MKKVYEKPNAEVLAFRLVDTVAYDTSYGEGTLPYNEDPGYKREDAPGLMD